MTAQSLQQSADILSIDNVTLEAIRDGYDVREATFGRRRRKSRRLRAYRVLDAYGKYLGKVYESTTTFETKTRGANYVNTRWTALRWYFESAEKIEYRRGIYRETRKAALEDLLYRVNLQKKEAVL